MFDAELGRSQMHNQVDCFRKLVLEGKSMEVSNGVIHIREDGMAHVYNRISRMARGKLDLRCLRFPDMQNLEVVLFCTRPSPYRVNSQSS